jgi:hypothetical protein
MIHLHPLVRFHLQREKIRKKPDSKPSYHRIISFEATEAQARWQHMVRGALTEAGVGESAP